VFENRVLRRIFGPKREEITGGWTKLHSEKLHDLYSSSNIIGMIKLGTKGIGRTCSTHEVDKFIRDSSKKTRKKKRLHIGVSLRRILKLILTLIGCQCMDWLQLASD
jgi:hypothetical protein